MNQLLAIVGPTATGKTALAVTLAKNQPSILISADSRQVYQGMDIVTGKDQPTGIKLYGIDLASPDEPCSVSLWYHAVMPHIERAWGEGKLPIVVGGTGLYVKALTHGIETINVRPDPVLRASLSSLTVIKLQEKLQSLSPGKLTSMNESDRANPRRLTRAIEVSLDRESHSEQAAASLMGAPTCTLIGLRYYDDSNYRSAIKTRVLSRLASGAVAETQALVQKYGESIESLTAIGYRSLLRFIKCEISEEEMVNTWVRDELAYAKRQLTWFKKYTVEWRFVDKPGNM